MSQLPTGSVFYYDIDGVLVRECGVAEEGYCFLIDFLRHDPEQMNLATFTEQRLLAVDQKYDAADEISSIRPKIKGKHPTEKICLLCELVTGCRYIPLCSKEDYRDKQLKELIPGLTYTKITSDSANQKFYLDPERAVTDVWFGYQRKVIERRFRAQKELYVVPHSAEILRAILDRQNEIVAVTANEQTQAEWLLDFAELRSYFTRIRGYSLRDRSMGTTKAEMIKLDLSVKRKRDDVDGAPFSFFVGDGVTDMQAAVKADVMGIGVVCDGTEDQRQRHAQELLTSGAKSLFVCGEDLQRFTESVKQALLSVSE